MLTVKVSEIFLSIQGETTRSGLPSVFIRLTGCPARCSWCDTEYAFKGGDTLGFDKIIKVVAEFGIKYVTLTGGEPLAQKNSYKLLSALCDSGFAVNLETGGMLDISEVDSRVSVTLDIKPPSSGEADNNLWDNLKHIKPKDEIKLVIADKNDYDWVKTVLAKYKLYGSNILLSPVTNLLNPADLANWILEDRLDVRMQLQLHKILWQDARGK